MKKTATTIEPHNSSCVPLQDVQFGELAGYQQLDLFQNECEGLCGV